MPFNERFTEEIINKFKDEMIEAYYTHCELGFLKYFSGFKMEGIHDEIS